MNTKNWGLLTSLLGLVSLLLASCSTATMKIGYVCTDRPDAFDCHYMKFTGVKSTIERLHSGETLVVDYDISVEQGTLELRIVDPTGAFIWEQEFGSPQADSISISADPGGNYRVIVQGLGTRGGFTVAWTVK